MELSFVRRVAAALSSLPLVFVAQAQTFVASVGTGCQVAVDALPSDANYRWQGD